MQTVSFRQFKLGGVGSTCHPSRGQGMASNGGDASADVRHAYARPRRTRAPSGAGSTAALACRGRPRASSSAAPVRRPPDRSAPATSGGSRPSSSSPCSQPQSAAACRDRLLSRCSALWAFQDRRRGKTSLQRGDRNRRAALLAMPSIEIRKGCSFGLN